MSGCVREDGTTVEAVVATVATTWEGRPAVQVVASDISALRRAERALASSDARYRVALRAGGSGHRGLRSRGTLRTRERRYSEIIGREGSALVGRPGACVVHPDDLDRARGEMADILADRQARTTFEWRCVRPDGKAAWIRSDVSVVRGEDGKPAHLMAVVADMTVSQPRPSTWRRPLWRRSGAHGGVERHGGRPAARSRGARFRRAGCSAPTVIAAALARRGQGASGSGDLVRRRSRPVGAVGGHRVARVGGRRCSGARWRWWTEWDARGS